MISTLWKEGWAFRIIFALCILFLIVAMTGCSDKKKNLTAAITGMERDCEEPLRVELFVGEWDTSIKVTCPAAKKGSFTPTN